MSNFQMSKDKGTTYVELSSSNVIDSKDMKKLKMTINNTNVLCTRTEDGNIFINNLSTEKIMEKDYDIKVNYNE